MLRLTLICFAVSFFEALSGQEIINKEPIGWKDKDIELHTIRDQSGQQRATFLVSEDSIRIFLLDQQDNIEKEFRIARINGEEIRGGFIEQAKIYLFCGYKFPRGLHNYVINIPDGSITQNLVISQGGKEEVIDRMSAGNCFLVFSINRRPSEFVISKWSSPDSADMIRYPMDEKIWKDITTYGGFSRSIDIKKVDEAGLPDVAVAGSQRKLYLVHDTLFLLLNKDNGITEIFTFDIGSRAMSFRVIRNEDVQIMRYGRVGDKKSGTEYISGYAGYSDNSYLLDGKLYFVSATSDRLHISIRDFYTEKELKKFAVEREDTNGMKNTPVIQEGQGWYGIGAVKELTKTKQLLRKMTAGNAVIAALEDSLGIAMTIGSNKEMQQMGSGGGGSFMPGGSSPGGMVYVPSGGFSRSTWTKSVRFRTLLDSNSLDHISGDMEASVNDRIEAFTQFTKIPANAENLFFHDDHYVYIYYDKTLRSLFFSRFSK
jgi:hypothetical protein